MSNAVANHCAWAVAFHSALALKEGVDGSMFAPSAKSACRRTPGLPRCRGSRALIEARGHVSAGELASFTAAGFGPDQVLEVIAGLAVSVMANHAGNITNPVLEQPFQSQAWEA